MKKILVLGVILLFVGVAVAPSINFTVAKASNDNDLVEVTTQACGIKGYGNTTVKLTREQYQNLEQYLIDFRARLNQTTTRGEAVPLFKEVVVELNKYRLLPKGMSVEQAQKLTTGLYQNRNMIMHQKKLLHNHLFAQENYSNFLCLIAGHTNHTTFENIGAILFNKIYCSTHNFFLFVFSSNMYKFLSRLCWINPLAVMNRINLGYYTANHVNHSASGWVTIIGLLGIKKIQGNMRGALSLEGTAYCPYPPAVSAKYPAAVGFMGIKIGFGINNPYIDLFEGNNFFYIGSAFWVDISTN